MLNWLQADGKKLLVTKALRMFGYGYLAVVLGLYLQQLGLSAFQVGIVMAAAVAGSALMNVFWSLAADRFGRRRTIATMALLMIAGGLLFALTDRLWLLVLAAFTGTISASSAEVGPFLTIEQAILPQTTPTTAVPGSSRSTTPLATWPALPVPSTRARSCSSRASA